MKNKVEKISKFVLSDVGKSLSLLCEGDVRNNRNVKTAFAIIKEKVHIRNCRDKLF